MYSLAVVFVAPVVSQVRFRKRIEALRASGARTTMLSFEREYFAGEPGLEYLSLGRVDHGNYFARIAPFVHALPVIRRAARTADVMYAFGVDLAFLTWLACRGLPRPPKIVYEIGDVRDALFGASCSARLLRSVERFLARRTDMLVVTSEAYVTGYYDPILGAKPPEVRVIENKLEKAWGVPRPPERERESALSIGYFGLLRCPRSWEILRRAAMKGEGRLKIYIRGYPSDPPDLPKEAAETPHVAYGGPYKAPSELPSLYGSVDIVWACYPYQHSSDGRRVDVGNWRLARTNRFYEACYFHKPLICQRDTEDARIVLLHGLGLALDLSDIEGSVDALLNIEAAQISRWRTHLQALPSDVYTYSTEHEELYRALVA